MGKSIHSNEIKVPACLGDPHQLVAQTKMAYKKATTRPDGIMWPQNLPCLKMRVSNETLDRALRIMDTLIKVLEAKGWKITLEQRYGKSLNIFSFENAEFEVDLIEYTVRTEHTPTDQEKDQIEKGKYLIYLPKWDYIPTGKLAIQYETQFGIRGRYRDGVRHRIEDCLGSFVARMEHALILKKDQDIKREDNEREWKKKEQIRNQEQKWLQDLNQWMESWQKSQMIRSFLQAIKEKFNRENESVSPGSDLDKFLTWAYQYADLLDPLVNKK